MSLPIRSFFRSATTNTTTTSITTTTTTTQRLRLRPSSLNSFIHSSSSLRGFSSTVANMGVHNIASPAAWEEAKKQSKDEGKILVLDAFATWCGPCKIIAPTVATWAEEEVVEGNAEKGKFRHVTFAKIDVDEVPDVAQQLDVRAMPTFIIFKNGEEEGRVVGANPNALSKRIEEVAGKAPEA